MPKRRFVLGVWRVDAEIVLGVWTQNAIYWAQNGIFGF